MNRATALLLGVVTAVLLSACDFSVYGLPLPGGPDTGENPISIEVEFADVLDLVPQSTVKVNDVSVGKVTAIDLEGYQALVTLEVRKDVKLPGNAIAELRQTSLLGEKFVELSAPDQGAIADPLSDRFETRVRVQLGKSKGKVTVEFASLDDLRRIVDVMDPRNRTDRPI